MEQFLREAFAGLEVNDTFTEAAVLFRDQSRLTFCHRVGERTARALGPGGEENSNTLAGAVLASLKLFRLNGKHLDLFFQDGSRWEALFREPRS